MPSAQYRNTIASVNQTVKKLLVDIVVRDSPGLGTTQTKLVRKRLKTVYQESTL